MLDWLFGRKKAPAPQVDTDLGTFTCVASGIPLWSARVESAAGRLALLIESHVITPDSLAAARGLLDSIESLDRSAREFIPQKELDSYAEHGQMVLESVVIDPRHPEQFHFDYGLTEWPDFGITVVIRSGKPVDFYCGD